MKPSANTFKTIGLYGIYGLYNFGCEAIVRGTYQMLKSALFISLTTTNMIKKCWQIWKLKWSKSALAKVCR